MARHANISTTRLYDRAEAAGGQSFLSREILTGVTDESVPSLLFPALVGAGVTGFIVEFAVGKTIDVACGSCAPAVAA